MFKFFSGYINRTLFLIVFISALPTLVFILNNETSRRSGEIARVHNQAANVLLGVAERQDLAFKTSRSLLMALAQLDVVREKKHPDGINLFADLLRLNNEQLSSLLLADAQGVVAVSGLPGLVGADLSQKDYIAAVLKNEQPFTGGITSENTGGIPSLFISFPVYDRLGTFTGIIAAGLRMDSLIQEQDRDDLHGHARFAAFDKRGALVFTFPDDYTPSPDQPAQLINIMQNSARSGMFVLDEGSAQERVLVHRALRFSDSDDYPCLYMGLTLDTHSAYAATYARLRDELLVLLGSVAVGCVLAWIIGRANLGRPVEQMSRAVQRLREGDLKVRTKLCGLHGELGVLAASFNEMACALEQHEAEIEEARHETELANQAKTEFLTNISHEIRTPMNAVIGMAYLALKTELSDKQRDYINKIYSSGNSLLVIINDLLDFSKIETGKMNIDAAPFMLEDVFNKLSAMVSPAAEAKGLEILFAVDPAVPQYLKGDSMRLSQILTNITTNAVKFTEHGEILINCAVLPPEDAGAGAGGESAPAFPGKPGGNKLGLQFVVHDTGIGMSKEQLSGLFTPFKQIDGSITRKYGGTGLGLALTKKLVQMMGGEIYISSGENEGTDVSFTIFVEGAVQARGIKNIPDLQGMRVLLVDDNETARQVISGMLSDLKLEAHTVASARAAYAELAEAEQKRRPYKLLLLDWRMPEITGLEAAKHVKNNLGLRECPVMLLVTAFGRSEITFSQQECGLSGIIYKPVSPSQLLNAVQDALEGEKSAGGAGAWPVYSSSERFKGCKVLLVEDNILNQEVVKEILAEAGMEAVTADTGQAAVELLLAGGNKFDAVLMDVQMPGMDGFTACKKLREEAGMKDLPVIALTAQGAGADREKFSAAGMNDYIVKPVDIDILLNTLSRWIPARDAAAGSDLRLAGSALPDLPGFNAKNALERLGGNARLYYTLAQQFCTRHSNADKLMDSAISYGNAQEAALEARSIKGLSATLGAESLSLKAARIEDFLSRNKNPDDEFYWLFDGFCAEFSFVLNMLGQALQLSGLKIVVEDAYNMSKCPKVPHAAGSGSAQAVTPLPEQEQQALKDRPAERTPGKSAEQEVKMGAPAEEPLKQQPDSDGAEGEKIGLSGETVDILITLKLKMEDDDASALTHLQSTLEVLAKEMPASQLQKLAQAVEIFDYSAGLETVRSLLEEHDPVPVSST